MAIDVEHAGASDLVWRDFFRFDGEAIGAAPEHGSLTGRLINHDVRRLVRAVPAALNEGQIDARTFERPHLNLAAFVIADSSDVARPQAEPRARDHRARDLPSGADDLFRERHLAAICGEARHDEHRVGRV